MFIRRVAIFIKKLKLFAVIKIIVSTAKMFVQFIISIVRGGKNRKVSTL